MHVKMINNGDETMKWLIFTEKVLNWCFSDFSLISDYPTQGRGMTLGDNHCDSFTKAIYGSSVSVRGNSRHKTPIAGDSPVP